MTARIEIDKPPRGCYTNLDYLTGRVLLSLHRPEHIGAIIVKLQGEASSSILTTYDAYHRNTERRARQPPGALPVESHKVLYRVQQAFPPEDLGRETAAPSVLLNPGLHEFPFRFRIPVNNGCGDYNAMASLGGLSGVGGFGSGKRVMDGTKQLFLKHTCTTLPPTFAGLPGYASVRYYVKVTVQRPGLLKENWRSELNFPFVPIEDIRPPVSSALSYARRPFVFSSRMYEHSRFGGASSGTAPAGVEIAALLPHPPILTCNQPVPLQLNVTKKNDSDEPIYLVALEITLIGYTNVRCFEIDSVESKRWVVFSQTGLQMPLFTDPSIQVGTEVRLPDDLWKNIPLPSSVYPSFSTCNLSRRYDVEIRLGVSRQIPGGQRPGGDKSGNGFTSWFKKEAKDEDPRLPPDTMVLPLVFNNVPIFSGITPPDELVQEARRKQAAAGNAAGLGNGLSIATPANSTLAGYAYSPGRASAAFAEPDSNTFVRSPIVSSPTSPLYPIASSAQGSSSGRGNGAQPPLPPRRAPGASAGAEVVLITHDPLYPPQRGTPADDRWQEAPPSYEDAVTGK